MHRHTTLTRCIFCMCCMFPTFSAHFLRIVFACFPAFWEALQKVYGECCIVVAFLSDPPGNRRILVAFFPFFSTFPAHFFRISARSRRAGWGCQAKQASQGRPWPGRAGGAAARHGGRGRGGPRGPNRDGSGGQGQAKTGHPGRAWAPRKTAKPPKQAWGGQGGPGRARPRGGEGDRSGGWV